VSSPPLIVGIGGTTRAGSTSERALQLALEACAVRGARTRLIGGRDLPALPYDPTGTHKDSAGATLARAVSEADGLLIATPSYHGSISGLVKNALDYVEDTREAARPYFDGRAVGVIVTAEGPQALGSTVLAVRGIIHALRGWPTPYAALLSVTEHPFGEDRQSPTAATRAALDLLAGQVMTFSLRWQA
jgi:FMN reductase